MGVGVVLYATCVCVYTTSLTVQCTPVYVTVSCLLLKADVQQLMYLLATVDGQEYLTSVRVFGTYNALTYVRVFDIKTPSSLLEVTVATWPSEQADRWQKR